MLFFKYLPGHYQGADHTGRRVLNFDSGGSSQPTATSTVSIPEYAKPYMEDVLGRAEALTTAPIKSTVVNALQDHLTSKRKHGAKPGCSKRRDSLMLAQD
jgi:hypothetical protein